MKGHSQVIESHEDLPLSLEQEQDVQIAVAEAREKLRQSAGVESLRAYMFTVETSQDDPRTVADSLEELRDLLKALGDSCVGETRQKLAKIHPPTLLGSGKVQEIALEARALEAHYVVCDRDLSHSQVRNLETIIRLPVLDRASIILQIFERHAKSREARIQVAIAHMEYLLPRLASSWVSAERQGGGGGSGGGAAKSRGAGESKLELSQRHVRERLERLQSELTDIQKNRATQRKSRKKEFSVALVGYTNAGKTTLMNALTGSALTTRDGVFETLDTTVRRLGQKGVENNVLLSDTVGFIRNLPHGLVASFRSTLQDACDADLLLHAVDASDENLVAHIKVTEEVLTEIGAGDVPRLVVFNKADRVASPESLESVTDDPTILVSALSPSDVERLRARILEIRRTSCQEIDVFIPYDRTHEIGALYAQTEVLSRTDDDDGTHLRVSAAPHVLERLLKKEEA